MLWLGGGGGEGSCPHHTSSDTSGQVTLGHLRDKQTMTWRLEEAYPQCRGEGAHYCFLPLRVGVGAKLAGPVRVLGSAWRSSFTSQTFDFPC